MKHHRIIWVAILLIAAILTGCGTAAPTVPQTDPPASTAAPTEAPTETPTEAPTTAPTEIPGETQNTPVFEDETVANLVEVVYAEQIGRYYTALTEKWAEDKYFENEMSALPAYYYEGEALDNVGFGFIDLDNDGNQELVIGAIQNAELDPVVFEIWTLVDGKPVMLVQSGARNRYFLQFAEEDNAWYVANEAQNGAASHGDYSLMLMDGKLEVMQGIVFDAAADEKNPWFMAYDLDWDVSNDEPIDEELANAILENNRSLYTSLEYFAYNIFK